MSYKTFIINYTLYKGFTILDLRCCNTATLNNGMLNTYAILKKHSINRPNPQHHRTQKTLPPLLIGLLPSCCSMEGP